MAEGRIPTVQSGRAPAPEGESPGRLSEPEQSGYRPIFGLSDAAKDSLSVPRWLPLSLLGLTTIALAVPIVLLRRQRTAALKTSLKSAPPPPRRTASSGTSPPHPERSRQAPPSRAAAPPPITKSNTELPPSSGNGNHATADDFNGALYTAKAFGIATFFVGVGAGTTIWGVKTALGVRNTQEFADRMRSFILTAMPVLSSRIHRSLDPGDYPSEESESIPVLGPQSHGESWSWRDAERRLWTAYEQGGFSSWARAALAELEAEGQAERVKRGHT